MINLIIVLPFIFSLLIGFFGRFVGRFGSVFLANFGLFINFFFSLIFLCFSLKYLLFFYTLSGSWLTIGSLVLNWSFSFDSLTIIMFFVVNTVSFIVHIFSSGYMKYDEHLPRFMCYISFFTFFMLILVTSDNIIQLFLGWEGVGLCSYLLIGFWYTRINAITSALKALIINRISDFAVIVAITSIFWYVFSFEFSIIMSIISFISNVYLCLFFNYLKINILTFLCLFILFGSMGKSAQILLHTWLPDAMEGPTPVSALIHAATMVTAGIFFILKVSFIFEYTPLILDWLIFIGGITAFMSGTIGIVQYDVKKVIAYSTCSQLGYMLLAIGLSNYFCSFFHLMNHAFFKALLFLCAGCIIHSFNNEQDIRRLGGLVKLLPITFFLMYIGTLALMGFPFLSGFYSKDFILEQILYNFTNNFINVSLTFVSFFLIITTALTVFYSLRLFFLIFLEKLFSQKTSLFFIHESNFILIFPLIILVIGSFFTGFFFKDIFLGIGSDFFSSTIFLFPIFNIFFDTEIINFFIKFFLFIMVIFFSTGIFFINPFFFKFLFKSYDCSLIYNIKVYEFFFFFNSKWAFDVIYNKYIGQFFFNIFYIQIFELFDKLFLERFFGHYSFSNFFYMFFSFLHNLFQTGRFFFYSFIFSLLFIYFLF